MKNGLFDARDLVYWGSGSTYENDNECRRYLRPVVVLDKDTTIKDVSILSKESIPEWSWVDTYGAYEAS